MNNKFYIGQIFEEIYPEEVADFCNDSQGTENACHITELKQINGKRMFKIIPNEQPSKEEMKRNEIQKYKSYLNDTDWYVYRFVDTGKQIPIDIKQKRQEARENISKLRKELESS